MVVIGPFVEVVGEGSYVEMLEPPYVVMDPGVVYEPEVSLPVYAGLLLGVVDHSEASNGHLVGVGVERVQLTRVQLP